MIGRLYQPSRRVCQPSGPALELAGQQLLLVVIKATGERCSSKEAERDLHRRCLAPPIVISRPPPSLSRFETSSGGATRRGAPLQSASRNVPVNTAVDPCLCAHVSTTIHATIPRLSQVQAALDWWEAYSNAAPSKEPPQLGGRSSISTITGFPFCERTRFAARLERYSSARRPMTAKNLTRQRG